MGFVLPEVLCRWLMRLTSRDCAKFICTPWLNAVWEVLGPFLQHPFRTNYLLKCSRHGSEQPQGSRQSPGRGCWQGLSSSCMDEFPPHLCSRPSPQEAVSPPVQVNLMTRHSECVYIETRVFLHTIHTHTTESASGF